MNENPNSDDRESNNIQCFIICYFLLYSGERLCVRWVHNIL